MVATSALAGAATSLWFHSLGGERLRLAQLQAQSPSGIVVCVLWCSHCASCRLVESELESLCQDMRGRALVVAVDASVGDDKSTIATYLEQHQRHFQVLLDPPGGLADRLKIRLTTTTVIFDAEGKIRYFGKLGPASEPSARLALEELLQGQPVSVPVTPLQGCTIRRP